MMSDNSETNYVKYDSNRPQKMKDMSYETKTTLAVTMIVKNEIKVLPRLFESIIPWLDYWVIHDTGSTDGTQKYIIDYFTDKNVPGELHHTPWKNFGYNRTLAIQSTKNKADYTMLLDADFVVKVVDPDFKNNMAKMGGHGYLIQYFGGLDYRQNLLVNTSFNWEYKGVTHEFIHATDMDNNKLYKFDGIMINHRADGGNRHDKFERDIKLLEEGLKDEPNNGRYLFYLGQSYKDLGGTKKNMIDYQRRTIDELKRKIDAKNSNNGYILTIEQQTKLKEKIQEMEKEIPKDDEWRELTKKCIEPYYKRAKIGGWGEEVYYSYLQIGIAKMRLEYDFWDFMPDLLHAYIVRPGRLEALFNLIRYCRLNKMANLGYHLGKMAEKNKYPTDYLFIDRSIHEWGFIDELALCSHQVGDIELAYKLGQRLVDEKKYPDRDKERIERNFQYFKLTYEKMNDANKLEPIPSIKSNEVIIGVSGPNMNMTNDVVKPIINPTNYEFVRIRPDIKKNRIALIITNYNMNERADQIVEYIKQYVKYPVDVILVDNGSDKQPASKYTALHLQRNVQTLHGWLMGLHYADSLEIYEEFKYFAYGFVITSSEIVPNQGDIITKLLIPMITDNEVVGIHPALSKDSTTWWKHMITHKSSNKWRHTNMIDNIFSIYRADWFNKQGRFNSAMTYAWGIDLEMSYFARRDGKRLLINDEVMVKKVSNIGYLMDRMNMTSEDRFKNAREQMNKYFVETYGKKHEDIIYRSYRIPEYTYIEPSLDDIFNEFTQREGGHRLLMEHIRQRELELKEIGATNGEEINMIEIGCSREEWTHLNSTYKLAIMAKTYGYNFMTIDVDSESITNVKRMVTYNKFKTINDKAENYLDEYVKNTEKRIHYVYLDGYDVSLSDFHHNKERKEKYISNFGSEMSNDQAYQMHLDCVKYIDERLVINGMICVNDIINSIDFQYKGRTAIPYLMRTKNYRIVKQANNAILLEKIANNNNEMILNNLGNLNYKKRYIVTLLGYNNGTTKHTNWYPWNRFMDVFKKMGYDTEWCQMDKLMGRITESNPRPRILICWNEPTCVELLKSGCIHKNDVIIQKLTSLGKGMDKVNWGNDAKSFFEKWNWPIYQTVEYLIDIGINIYAFGCHSHSEDFPEKQRIVDKLNKKGKLFWINWGSTVFDYDEIMNCKPVIDGFTHDIGYVGSKWGTTGRGNTDQWNNYIEPLLTKDVKTAFYGFGFPEGMISDDKTKEVLKSSRICPILHAPSWVAEKGIQDRFYTVFTAGRFGVVDNPGVYDFFTEDEVVCETDPIKYVEKTRYFMEHPNEQIPYIQKVQEKIRTKYNLYVQWDNILNKIIMDQQTYETTEYEFLSKINKICIIPGPFYNKLTN